jgi:hypothetical protein
VENINPPSVLRSIVTSVSPFFGLGELDMEMTSDETASIWRRGFLGRDSPPEERVPVVDCWAGGGATWFG